MRTAPLSATQICLVTAFLSLLVYYLAGSGVDSCRGGVTWHGFHHLRPEPGNLHVLVTGGAGYIGSHASKQLLQEGHAVTVVDNLSRGNLGAIRVLQRIAASSRFQFIQADLGDSRHLLRIFERNKFDVVLHFAAVAYVGESMTDPLRYYRNITSNMVNILDAMRTIGVTRLIFSSTCAVYGNPDTLPVTEDTHTRPVNPYGRAKLMAERAILDVCQSNVAMKAVILRYFNVYGSDPDGLLGEYPDPTLRQHSRISGACLDAALKQTSGLTIKGAQLCGCITRCNLILKSLMAQ